MAEQIEKMSDREVLRQLKNHFHHLRICYSLGWQCAGMVLGAMREQGWEYEITHGPDERECAVGMRKGVDVVRVFADQVPRAVCEAALKAKGVGE